MRSPGFEPGSSAWQAGFRAENSERNLNWADFREWLENKYSDSWAKNVFCYAEKYHKMLNGDLTELESFSKSKKNNVLKSLIALSKYLGVYREFKARKSNYGIQWEGSNSLQAFLRTMTSKDGLVEWVRECMDVLDKSKSTFIRYLAISGIRTGEAIKSFNLIMKFDREGRLDEYYNRELKALEHFRFEKEFIRGSKNVFFSFVSEDLIQSIAACEPLSYAALRNRLKRHGLNMRLNELRDYYATFMVQHRLIREEVDLLQGRVGKSIFMRHYSSPSKTWKKEL